MPNTTISNDVFTVLQQPDLASMKAALGVALDGSGFTGNLPVTVDTLQELADAVDQLDAAQSALLFATPAAMLASTIAGAEGKAWRAGPYTYVQLASAAAEFHLQTAGGVKLNVQPDAEGVYDLHAFGVTAATPSVQNEINAVLKKLGAYTTLRLPKGTYSVAVSSGTGINAGSSATNGGILGAIYLEAAGQRLIGDGYDTVIDGGGGAFNAVMVRDSRCRVSSLRIGNVAGDLTTGRAAAIAFEPSNFVQGSGTGADIEDLTVEDCDLFDCDVGIAARPEWDDLGASNYDLWTASRLVVKNNRITGYREHGVELFQCDRSSVIYNRITGIAKGAITESKAIAVYGSNACKIHTNHIVGADAATAGYIGIHVGHSSFYDAPEFFDSSEDVQIYSNHLSNFNNHLRLGDVRGTLQFNSNVLESPQDALVRYGVFIDSTERYDVAGATTLTNKRSADRVVIQNNQAIGASRFIYVAGRVGSLMVDANHFVGNTADDSGLITFSMATNGNATVDGQESVGSAMITNNTSICKVGATLGDIRFVNTKTGDWFLVGDNKSTRDQVSIVVIDGSALGTVNLPTPTSNVTLPSTLFARDFNPARADRWTGN